MRILLVLLLVQSIAPSIFSEAAVSSKENTVLTPIHSPIVFPVFVKEQEEREHEESLLRPVDFVPLIDFSNQSHNFTSFQTLIYKGYNHQAKFNCQPPLFELHSTFLI
jgi:hypothetical protein